MKPPGGQCPICQHRPATNFDHNHQTGAGRGWLCSPCNLTLGAMNDQPEWLRRAADYLERTSR